MIIYRCEFEFYLNEISLDQSEITFDLSEILFYQSEKTFDPIEILFDQSLIRMKSYWIQIIYYLIKMKFIQEIGIYLNETEFYALFTGNLIYVYVKENSEIQFSTNEVRFQLVLSR